MKNDKVTGLYKVIANLITHNLVLSFRGLLEDIHNTNQRILLAMKN